MLGRALDLWWDELGRPDPFVVVDAGTGPGTLAAQLAALDGPSASARTVIGYDHDDPMPADLDGAVVIANELLDNLPFRVVERGGDGWFEWWVDVDAGAEDGAEGEAGAGPGPVVDGGPGPVRLAPVPLTGEVDPAVAATLALLGVEHDHQPAPGSPADTWVEGTRVPVLERAAGWVDDVRQRGAAMIVAFDYGRPTTVELARRGGWLRTYRRHERGDDPFHQPGGWDITTDVAVDQLPAASEIATQADFLRTHGIDELVDEGRRYWQAHAARPDLAAMRMRSRVNEAAALTDPDGLGGWLTICWRA